MYAVKGNNIGTIEDARLLEQGGKIKEAAAMYEKLFKRSPQNLKIVYRLMVLHRKLKNITKELRYINAAIKINEQYYLPSKKIDNKATAISKQLNRLLGYATAKGQSNYKSEEILKLQARKTNLLNKQERQKKK